MKQERTKIDGSFDFSINNDINKEIQELEKIISFEKENIYTVLNCASMQGKILDLGCGPGSTTEIIANYDPCIQVTGVDREPRFIEYAKNRKNFQKTQYIVGDCYDLPLANNSFDCCYARYLFQHLKYPLKALNEIKRVIKPNGIIGIHDFDYKLLKVEPEIPGLRKLQRFNALVKAFRGGDAFVGGKLEKYFMQVGIKNVSTVITQSNNCKNKDFISLFYNFELDNKNYLIKNGIFSEPEYHQLNSDITNFITNENSFFEICNYFIFGLNDK